MQNSLNKEGNIVEFSTKNSVEFKGATVPSELSSQAPKINLQQEILLEIYGRWNGISKT